MTRIDYMIWILKDACKVIQLNTLLMIFKNIYRQLYPIIKQLNLFFIL